MTLTIRPALATDVDGLSALAALTFPLACPRDLPRASVEAFVRDSLGPASFRGYLEDPTHRLLAGVGPDGDVLAYALLIEGTAMDESCARVISSRPTVGVSKFYLHPCLHGSGEAGRLLDVVIRLAQDSGARSLWLATNVANSRALAFYARSGFERRGHRDFMVGGVRNLDVVLERPVQRPLCAMGQGGPDGWTAGTDILEPGSAADRLEA